MLPARHRMRRAPDFRSAVRRGVRAGGEHLVVHLLVPPDRQDDTGTASTASEDDATASTVSTAEAGRLDTVVGLIVPRAVGDAVHRTLVKRRLRHVMAQRLHAVPAGSAVVVRATAGAAQASSAVLAAEVDAALARCQRPRRPRTPRPPRDRRPADPAPALSGAPR